MEIKRQESSSGIQQMAKNFSSNSTIDAQSFLQTDSQPTGWKIFLLDSGTDFIRLKIQTII